MKNVAMAIGWALIFCTLPFINLGCSLPSAGDTVTSSASVTSVKLIQYTREAATINLTGTLPSEITLSVSPVELHLKSDCTDTSLGKGLAQNFSKTGIDLKVPIDQSINIYASINTSTSCVFLTSYQFILPPVPAPKEVTSSPASPSRTVSSPLILGSVPPEMTVKIFTDSSCTAMVGSGNSSDFQTLGLLATLAPNQSQLVYGQTTDAFDNKSACAPMLEFIHSTGVPTSPVFGSSNPVSPNFSSVAPTIVGTASFDTATVSLYSDANCSNILATGTKQMYEQSGLQISVNTNVMTTVYGRAFAVDGAPSSCAFLTNYLYDNIKPLQPTFNFTNPTSPTRMTTYPKVSGFASVDTVQVRLYNDAACVTSIGLGSKLEFETIGVSVGVARDALTPIYAMNFDAAGNSSVCTKLTDFINDTIPPLPAVFGSTLPVSPNNITSSPYIGGYATDDTSLIKFYTEDTCTTTAIGSGAGSDFSGSGIQIFTPSVPNSVNQTSIYSISEDIVGNKGECNPLATYDYSTAKAVVPVFSMSVPASPSRTVSQPYILGTAVNSISIVSLYSDNSCSTLIGSASRAVYSSQGIRVTLSQNTITNIYAISIDKYGNSSDCILFTQYTHDNIAPIAPTYIATLPASPNNQSITPDISGGVTVNSIGKPLAVSTVNIYDGFLCLTKIGFGSPALFSGSGVTMGVGANTSTYIYAQTADDAGNVSPCTSMVTYTHSDRPPGIPLFASASPSSPSYTNQFSIVGTLGSSTDILPATQVLFYQDTGCTNFLAQDTVLNYTSTGVSLVANVNDTTPIYARTIDSVGNMSACTQQLDFIHNNNGPSGLTLFQNQNGSVNLGWQPDLAASPAPKYVVKRSTKAGGPYSVLAWANAGTSYTDFTVSEGKSYYYVVEAKNATGSSLNSNEASITVSSGAVQIPLTLTANPGPGVVALSWVGFSSDMYYKVMRSTQRGGPYTQILDKYKGTSYADKTVSNSTNYYYVVLGTNPSGTTVGSNEASATPVGVPVAPANLKATQINSLPACSGGLGVVLSWTAPSYYTKFAVKLGFSPGSGNDLSSSVNTNSYIDCSSLTNDRDPTGDNRYYNVEAIWGPSEQQFRSLSSVVVPVKSIDGPSVTVFPGNNQIFVSWLAANGAVDYQIWRSPVKGWPSTSYTLLDGHFGGISYNDTSVTNGNEYYYVILANYSTGATSWPSSEASGIPLVNPSAPTNLKVSPGANNTINLDWSGPSYYNKFNIYRSTNLGGPYVFVTSSNKTSFADSPGGPGLYYYYVKAQWGSYETAETGTVSYRYGYSSSLIISTNASGLTLSWAGVGGAFSYNILRSTTSGGPYVNIANTAALTYVNSTTVPVANVAVAGDGYFYVVQPVFGDSSTGQYSSEVSGMLTGATVVSGLTVTETNVASVNLAWAKLGTGFTYNIYKATALGGPYTLASLTTNTSATVTSLNSNTTYYFKVANRSCTTTCLSSAVSALVVGTPLAPSVTPGLSTVNVTWGGVVGATSYNLLRSTDAVNYSTLASGVTGGTYDDNTAVNGTLYLYKIAAFFPGSISYISPPSNGVTPGVAPSAPVQLSVSENINGTDVGLVWAKVSGATSYSVYLSSTSGGPWGAPFLNSTSNVGNYFSGLTAGNTYYAMVRALNGSILSSDSAELRFVPQPQSVAPTVVATNTSIELSFSAVAGASNYDILRSSDGGLVFTTVSSHQVSSSYTDNTVVTGNSYIYAYIPYDVANVSYGISLPSISISIQPTVAPTDLFAMAPDDTSVKLNWVFSLSPQTASYNVYRSTSSGGPYALVNNISASIGVYLDSGLTPGSTYFYVVSSKNSFGVESQMSNEVSVALLAGPASLGATNTTGGVNLTWSSVAGATGYQVFRGKTTGGPYGLVADLGAVTSYLDSAVENNNAYFYIVMGKYVSGASSVTSNEATATYLRTINIQFPIELLDQGLSSKSTPVIFERSRTSVDPTAYDGTVSYEFEIVAKNLDGSSIDVSLVDESDVVKATVVLPGNTTQPTRYRSVFVPNGAFESYRMSLSATSSSGQAQIYSARLWVSQTGATKSKVYIPMLSSADSPVTGDKFSPVESTSQQTFKILDSSTIFIRDTTRYSKLLEFNAWELEAVVASTGPVGVVSLYNTNTSSAVDSAEVIFKEANPTLVNAQFNEGVTNFSNSENLHNYRLAMKCYADCTLGSVNIYKAGLWVNLENITKMEIYIRLASGSRNNMTPSYIEQQRSLIDLTQYSNPSVYFRAVGKVSSGMGDSTTVDLVSLGTADSGVIGASSVSSGTLSFSSSSFSLQQTPSSLTLTTGQRFLPYISPIQGTFDLLDSYLIIRNTP